MLARACLPTKRCQTECHEPIEFVVTSALGQKRTLVLKCDNKSLEPFSESCRYALSTVLGSRNRELRLLVRNECQYSGGGWNEIRRRR